MEKDWITVYKATKRFNVEMMKHHMDVAGIESVILDQTDSSYIGIPGVSFEAKLQVRKENEVQAREIVQKYDA